MFSLKLSLKTQYNYEITTIFYDNFLLTVFIWSRGLIFCTSVFIALNSLCSMCGEEEETTSHIFCTCKVAWLVRTKCFDWMGVTSIAHYDPKKHFAQFRLTKESEVVNNIWFCVWVVVVGELWKQRNKKSFRNGTIGQSEIFTMVQLKVWSWVTANVRLTLFLLFWLVSRTTCFHEIRF